MTRSPHDVADLYLAPVLLAVAERISEMSLLSTEELRRRVAIESNLAEHTEEMREQALLASVGYLLDLHGWELRRHPRGLEVTHGTRHVVLGTPVSFDAYVAGGREPVATA